MLMTNFLNCALAISMLLPNSGNMRVGPQTCSQSAGCGLTRKRKLLWNHILINNCNHPVNKTPLSVGRGVNGWFHQKKHFCSENRQQISCQRSALLLAQGGIQSLAQGSPLPHWPDVWALFDSHLRGFEADVICHHPCWFRGCIGDSRWSVYM